MYARALAILLLFTACGASSQAKLHARALAVTHGVLDTAGHAIEEACPLAVERADTLERARQIGESCRHARDVQHTAVEVWMTWATATLARMEDRSLDLALALDAARRFLALYQEIRVTLGRFDVVELPKPPSVLLRLVGVPDED